MKDNVLKLVKEARNAVLDFEEYMYENFKEKYVSSKCVLDRNKENIDTIEREIDSIDLEEAESELTNIIDSIKEAKESLENHEEDVIINNSVPELNDETVQMEETIDNTISELETSFEGTNLEEVLEPIDEEVIQKKEETLENIDEDAINAFLEDNNLDV